MSFFGTLAAWAYVGLQTVVVAGLTVGEIIAATLLVASAVIQQRAAAKARDRANQQRENADAAADAAKGTQIVISSEVIGLRIIYGRALVGGSKLYHRTSNNFIYQSVGPNGKMWTVKYTPIDNGRDASQIEMDTGESGYNFVYWKKHILRQWNGTTDHLAQTRYGKANEYLFTQQAIAHGGLHAIYDIDIDGKKIGGEYVDQFGDVVYNFSAGDLLPTGGTLDLRSVLPLDTITSYGEDGTPQYTRTYVPNPAYIPQTPAVIKLVKAFTQGCKIHAYTKGNIADPLMTANDPSRINALFTDVAYLTGVYRFDRNDPEFGGPPEAQCYCEGMEIYTIVGTAGNRTLSATKVYSNNSALVLLDYLTSVKYGRKLPLSVIDLDSFYDAAKICAKLVKENVPLEGTLWRQKGGIRNIYLYETNLGVDPAKTIRENVEDLLTTMEFAELVWSGGKYKLQLKYISRYLETTWPSAKAWSAGDVIQYVPDGEAEVYLRKSLIDNNTSDPMSESWEDAIDSYITDDNIIRDSSTSVSWPNAQTRLNHATVKFLNEAKDFKEDTVSWPQKDSSVYATFLAEDSEATLETELFAVGCTSYYAALAKAEFTVRHSRMLVTYELTVERDYIQLEPGDIVKLTSDVLRIPGELLFIEDVQPNSTGAIDISASKIDAAMFPWEVPDDEIVAARNIYTEGILRTEIIDVIWDNLTDNLLKLVWLPSQDERVASYDVMLTTDNLVVTSLPDANWIKIGSTTDTFLSIPYMGYKQFSLAVVPVTYYQSRPTQQYWDSVEVNLNHSTMVSDIVIKAQSDGLLVTWICDIPLIKYYEIRIGNDVWATADFVKITSDKSVLIPVQALGLLTIQIKTLTRHQIESDVVSIASIEIVKPATPANFLINGRDLVWNEAIVTSNMYPIDVYEIRMDGGDTVNWEASTPLLIVSKSNTFAKIPDNVSGIQRLLLCTKDVLGNYSNPTWIVVDTGDRDIANVVESFVPDAPFWAQGTLVGCTVQANPPGSRRPFGLYADIVDKFYGEASAPFYGNSSDNFFTDTLSSVMSFRSQWFPILSGYIGRPAFIDYEATGATIAVSYMRRVPNLGLDNYTEPDYIDIDYTGGYEEQGPFPYTGEFDLGTGEYQLFVEISGGTNLGSLKWLSLDADMPDVIEVLSDIVIPSTGFVLNDTVYTKTFNQIKAVTVTIQEAGTHAVSARVAKTNPAVGSATPTPSAIITAYDAANLPVNNTIADIQIKGY